MPIFLVIVNYPTLSSSLVGKGWPPDSSNVQLTKTQLCLSFRFWRN